MPYLDHLDGMAGAGTGEEDWKGWTAAGNHEGHQGAPEDEAAEAVEARRNAAVEGALSQRSLAGCVQAGQGRPHLRITQPKPYTLAVDLSGKMKKGGRVAYFLVGVYTYLKRRSSHYPLMKIFYRRRRKEWNRWR